MRDIFSGFDKDASNDYLSNDHNTEQAGNSESLSKFLSSVVVSLMAPGGKTTPHPIPIFKCIIHCFTLKSVASKFPGSFDKHWAALCLSVFYGDATKVQSRQNTIVCVLDQPMPA